MADTARFDAVAANWDEEPSRVRLATAVAEAVTSHVPVDPSTDVLDFGCGTGLLTLALQPAVRHITGADTSPGMLGVLERKVQTHGLTNVRTHLLRAEDGFALAGDYDLIVSSMTLHHVEDLRPLFDQFRARLKPGGWVALADLDREDGTFHKPEITDVYHLGFERSAVRELLQERGFDTMGETTAFTHQRHGKAYPVFLIWARVLKG